MKLLNNFKQWLIHWTWIITILAIAWISYAAFNDTISEVTTGSNLQASEYNKIVQKLNAIKEEQLPTAMAVFSADTTNPVDIRSNFNIDSIIRNSTWNFTINFSNPMNNTNYNVQVSVIWAWRSANYTNKTTTSVDIIVRTEAGTFQNQPELSLLIFWWN